MAAGAYFAELIEEAGVMLIKGLPELNRRYICFLLKQLIE